MISFPYFLAHIHIHIHTETRGESERTSQMIAARANNALFPGSIASLVLTVSKEERRGEKRRQENNCLTKMSQSMTKNSSCSSSCDNCQMNKSDKDNWVRCVPSETELNILTFRAERKQLHQIDNDWSNRSKHDDDDDDEEGKKKKKNKEFDQWEERTLMRFSAY